jgi:hypothetical protein
MRLGWAVLILGGAAALAGCGQSKPQALAECRMEAAKVYKMQTEMVEQNRAADFVSFCMAKKGYTIGTCERDLLSGYYEYNLGCYRKSWPWE